MTPEDRTVRRYVEWRINGIGQDQWEAVRYENGKTIGLGLHASRNAAMTAAEYDRAVVLADPMATEARPVETKIRWRRRSG